MNIAVSPKFITVEGIEGVGKSTIVEFLQQQFAEANIDYVATREPGGTEIAENIRTALLTTYSEPMEIETELLLMFACRVQNIEHIIKPALARGQWVLSDRFTDASFAYQGGGRGIDKERIQALEHWLQGELQPDITLLLDAPIDIALARMHKRGAKDRIEREGEAFFERVREAYLARAAKHPERYRIINTDQSLDQVKHDVLQIFSPWLVSDSA